MISNLIGLLILIASIFLIWIIYISPKPIKLNLTGRNRGRLLFLLTLPLGLIISFIFAAKQSFQEQLTIVFIVYLIFFGVIKILEFIRENY